ncbi:MAG: winged helix-turn-helix domain-containing protein [candidate division WOR-3 bacterium]
MKLFGNVLLDYEAFRALASHVRIEILKKLDEGRSTVTDLSRRLSMSKSTVHKHLERLVEVGLISKVEDERKWVYYEITPKGARILHPENVQVSLILSTIVLIVGILFISTAIYLIWFHLHTFEGERVQFHLLTVLLGLASTVSGYYMLRRCPWN